MGEHVIRCCPLEGFFTFFNQILKLPRGFCAPCHRLPRGRGEGGLDQNRESWELLSWTKIIRTLENSALGSLILSSYPYSINSHSRYIWSSPLPRFNVSHITQHPNIQHWFGGEYFNVILYCCPNTLVWDCSYAQIGGEVRKVRIMNFNPFNL